MCYCFLSRYRLQGILGALDNGLGQFVLKIHRYRFALFLRNTPRKCSMMAARAARLYFPF